VENERCVCPSVALNGTNNVLTTINTRCVNNPQVLRPYGTNNVLNNHNKRNYY